MAEALLSGRAGLGTKQYVLYMLHEMSLWLKTHYFMPLNRALWWKFKRDLRAVKAFKHIGHLQKWLHFFLSCVFYKRPIHSWMAEGISKHIERCRICSSRSPLKSGLCEICERREGFFKSEACKRCESHTTQLCCEVKTTRNLCLKCQDFTEKFDSLIQTEIDFCQDCHVPMKILSDEIKFICLRCSLVRKKNFFS